MSYNVKGHGAFSRQTHIDEVASVIREIEPDLVGLQEMHRFTPRSRDRDQLAELEAATGMTSVFGRSVGFGQRGEYGNAILTRGGVVDQTIYPLPGRGEPRTLLRATVTLDGFLMSVFVTHFTAWWMLGRRTRIAQAAEVAKIVERSDLPFVLVGDFNSTPGSRELSKFHDGSLVTSCFAQRVVTHPVTRSCLDYVFVSRDWDVRHAEVLKKGPSDHWPLVVRLERKQSASSAERRAQA